MNKKKRNEGMSFVYENLNFLFVEGSSEGFATAFT
jgi:hypothetical protein